MDFQRIAPTIDVPTMQLSHVTVVGGAFGLIRDLVRCGLGAVTLVDFDRVAGSNPARQDLFLALSSPSRYTTSGRGAAIATPPTEPGLPECNAGPRQRRVLSNSRSCSDSAAGSATG